ncbi:hypothetical protein ABEB36_000235 [Hypothenemus hampei]|uniref:CCHC-type domain-containing protein n=1 Tax=Hypothenemus hampei TaxID=57062 RepID=A0ABD1FAL3_HYPHA
MSDSNLNGPRAGPASCGEPRTPATAGVYLTDTGGGGGIKTSQSETESVISSNDNRKTYKPGKVNMMGPPSGQRSSCSSRKNSTNEAQIMKSKNPADVDTEEEETFIRQVKSKTRRSTRTASTADLNKTVSNIDIDLTSEKDGSRSVNIKKRPRETTPTYRNTTKRINQGPGACNQKIIEEMCIKIGILEKAVLNTYKPKAEIKNAVMDLSRGNCQCSVELEALRRVNAELKIGLSDFECVMLELRNIPGAEDAMSTMKKTANFIKQTLEQQIKTKKSLEKIIELTWDPSCYRVTKMRWPNEVQDDMMYILEDGKLEPRELDRIFSEQPDARKIINKLKNGNENFIIIKNDSSIVFDDKEQSVPLKKQARKKDTQKANTALLSYTHHTWWTITHGHYANTCNDSSKGAGIRGRCLQCAGEGHTAKDCPNPPICYECNRAGHKAGSMKCEVFRQLVDRERKAINATKRRENNKKGTKSINGEGSEIETLTQNECSDTGSTAVNNRVQGTNLNREESNISVDSFQSAKV